MHQPFAEPRHSIKYRLHCFGGRSRNVCVFDPQDKLAAVMAGEKPVEQSGAGATNMEETGRRGRKTRHHGLGHRRKSLCFTNESGG